MFAHCTFVNVSFKGCEITDSRFMNCTFISCYFRKTLIRNCKLDGCKFIDCDFPKVRVQGTDFMFPRFEGCFIAFDEMRPNLPPEPELRANIAAELAREAQVLGETRDARLFRIQALRAHETHLWRAFRASSSYYKEHITLPGRLAAGGRWLASRMQRVVEMQLWTHQAARPAVGGRSSAWSSSQARSCSLLHFATTGGAFRGWALDGFTRPPSLSRM
jgi:hypothetical protein